MNKIVKAAGLAVGALAVAGFADTCRDERRRYLAQDEIKKRAAERRGE